MNQVTKNGVTYYIFNNLSAERDVAQANNKPGANPSSVGVRHLFSTRLGGVSTGYHESMNLSFINGDDPEAVSENFRRIESLGFPVASMVFSQQTHKCEVRVVTEADCGKGIQRDRDYTDIDALVTNVPGITLATFYADCVPLYFYDPVQSAIGLAHAGWRGTVGEIGVCTLEAMIDNYGTNPSDVLVGIGPSICKDCFEVGNEVAEEFCAKLDFAKDYIKPCADLPNKSYIDLQGINRQSLINAGIPSANIELPGICTKENPNTFFSHRIMGTKRGIQTALLSLEN